MQQARQFGKEFNEAIERRILGLPPVSGREPVFIPQSDVRTRLTRDEDMAGQRELEDLIAKNSVMGVAERNLALEAEIEALRAQIASLTGQEGKAPAPAPEPKPKPAAKRAATVLPEGIPDEKWTRSQILEFGKSRGFATPPKGGFGMTTLAALDFVLGELKKAEEAAEG